MTSISGRSTITYWAVHKRLSRVRGSARRHRCYYCDEPAVSWAYDRADADELIVEQDGYTLVYSADIDRYVPACWACHMRIDQSQRRSPHCSEGHPFTMRNTDRRVHSDGSRQRVCRECQGKASR